MIFRKNRPGDAGPEEKADTPEAPQPRAGDDVTGATAEAGAGGVSMLTSDVVMEGNLVTSGDLHLDGTVHGAVQAQRVVITPNGAVNGQVVAQEVEIHGRVIGPICAVRVKLMAGAQVEGDVMSQSISVDEGAFIDGQIRHSEDPLGEWQQMWYGEDGAARETTEDTAEDAAPDLAPYLRPESASTEKTDDGAATEEDDGKKTKTSGEDDKPAF